MKVAQYMNRLIPAAAFLALILVGDLGVAEVTSAETEVQVPLETNVVTTVTNAAPAATPLTLSPAAAELVKLIDGNIEDSVMLAYIKSSNVPFNLSAADIVYLKDLGLSTEVVTAMMQHDNDLRQNATAVVQSPPTNSAPAVPAPEPPPANNAAPQPDGDIYQAPGPVSTAPPPAPAPAPLVVAARPANLPPEVDRFYDALLPFGQWMYTAEFGWVWRPMAALVNREWRPYGDSGRWVWTDRGWFWASDYSWGDITFHYGRWYLSQEYGWVWFPDVVWAPAWVTWRVYDDYCGWAPLPPATYIDVNYRLCYRHVVVRDDCDFDLWPSCFVFVPFRHCFTPNPRFYCVPQPRVHTFFQASFVINNYGGHKHDHGHEIVNRGVDVRRAARESGKDIKPIPVVSSAPSGQVAGPRITKNGQTIAVVQKPLPAPKSPVSSAFAPVAPTPARQVSGTKPVENLSSLPPRSPSTPQPATATTPSATERQHSRSASPHPSPGRGGDKTPATPLVPGATADIKPAPAPANAHTPATPATPATVGSPKKVKKVNDVPVFTAPAPATQVPKPAVQHPPQKADSHLPVGPGNKPSPRSEVTAPIATETPRQPAPASSAPARPHFNNAPVTTPAAPKSSAPITPPARTPAIESRATPVQPAIPANTVSRPVVTAPPVSTPATAPITRPAATPSFTRPTPQISATAEPRITPSQSANRPSVPVAAPPSTPPGRVAQFNTPPPVATPRVATPAPPVVHATPPPVVQRPSPPVQVQQPRVSTPAPSQAPKGDAAHGQQHGKGH